VVAETSKTSLRPNSSLVVEQLAQVLESEWDGMRLALPPSFDEALKQAGWGWARLWRGDIQIEGDVAAQQMVRSWLFNLYQTAGSDFLPPMGFSSDWYGGRVFWDQETWMLPALLPFRPEYVQRALIWRNGNLPAARANAKAKGYQGALFPWESTPDGQEGAPAEFQNEIHINGDVLFAARRAMDWGVDFGGYDGLSVEIARFWASRVHDGHIRHVISPDEGTFVDDDLYTNALAAWCLREGARYEPKSAKRWRELADRIVLLKDPKRGIYLTYDRDPGRSYKQAAALLAIYPLGLPMDRATQERMFDFYKDRVIDNGPAMTDAIHAIIAARLGRRGEMERYLRKSYDPFERPGLQFSEKRRGTPRTYFLTGAGGCLQAVLYGVAGLEIVGPGAANPPGTTTKDLGGGYRLGVRPVLPAGWRTLTLKGIHARGKVFSITISPKGVRFDEGG
jgi:trehalose/maltose hydrolase-like predicted phosphorylase